MGSGKTTMCTLLAKEFGFSLFEEKVNENPYLTNYYEEPHKWAYKSQLFYLQEKIAQLMEVKELLLTKHVVQDTPIYQDCFSYAYAQKLLGYMNEEEYANYLQFFSFNLPSLPAPHVIVQLDAPVSVLVERIKKRARTYEQAIDKSYLEMLSKLQQDWVTQHAQLNVVRIPVDNDQCDILGNETYRKECIQKIKQSL